ncbi:mitochondrial import inner membrane translocase subunit TIM50-C-like [Macrosteles quadrilineatus]|uniref:mitochondrial import inner membrane translocase subunit TIM50-C-like n=1 Tax=Macrosteles quadrilineatus TaxID=74068 RepID=UPI0023E0C43C|nr:mitochondrial import inner membrane translocase subunit TIM50-C-like [Macrosteles quadrilineatus]
MAAAIGRTCHNITKSLVFNALCNSPSTLKITRRCNSVFKTPFFQCSRSSPIKYFKYLPVGCSSLYRHYATDKIDPQKILETAFPPPKESVGSNPNKDQREKNEEDEEELRKREQSWRTMKLSLIAMGSSIVLLGGYIIISFGAPLQNEDGSFEEDEFSRLPTVSQYLKRAYRNSSLYLKMIQEPSRKKLLPDPVTYPYIQPPYTLVLEMTDLLVHPEWTYSTGWRFKKRPGVDQFLEQVAPPLFETVIYTAEPGMIAFPILATLDSKGSIMYRLFRDATDYIDGHHVKNLDCLNRDLKRVIVVDWNPDSVKLHRANTLLIPQWKGDVDDTSLIELAAFLRTIADNQVDDVRDVLLHYSQYDDPLETFKERQIKLLEESKKLEEARKKEPSKFPWKPKSF